MRLVVTLLLFAGIALIIHSIYEEKYQRIQKQVRVEYRFLPRTLYEEQMEQTGALGKFNKMFKEENPWH